MCVCVCMCIYIYIYIMYNIRWRLTIRAPKTMSPSNEARRLST